MQILPLTGFNISVLVVGFAAFALVVLFIIRSKRQKRKYLDWAKKIAAAEQRITYARLKREQYEREHGGPNNSDSYKNLDSTYKFAVQRRLDLCSSYRMKAAYQRNLAR